MFANSFFYFGHENIWIRIRIDLKCWIRIRIEVDTDPKYWIPAFLGKNCVQDLRNDTLT